MIEAELVFRHDMITKYDFREFVKKCFATLNPTTPLDWNWHMELLCWEAIRTMPMKINPVKDPAQRVRRLIINVPPRSLKSETFSVAYTCFVQGHCPNEQMLTASYAAKLTMDLHNKARMVVESEWYQRIFPETQLAFSTKTEWKTTKNGHRQTVTVGGTTTGLGGNILIADDIMSVDIANSETERNNANEWFGKAFSTRLSNPKNGVVIVIMQRLHQDDTTGHILDKDTAKEWRQVCLPIQFDAPQVLQYYEAVKFVHEGELLSPNRWDESVIESLKSALGAEGFAGQYLQTPVPAGGSILPVDKLETHVEAELPPLRLAGCTLVASLDTASKAKVKNDYSVMQLWLNTPYMSYMIEQERVKMEYPQLKEFVKRKLEEWAPDLVLIEDKGSGTSLIQDLRGQTHHAIYPINPRDSKTERAERVAPLIDTGNVSVDKNNPHYGDFIMECTYFPKGRNDDMVDAMTQYLDWVRTKKNAPKVKITLL